MDRFRREAKIIAQLSSNPHVVTIYDVGEMDDQTPFLVTEFLPGNPLADELRSKYKPSRSWVLDIAVQVASALADAHNKRVVHRDLKPANVFIMRHPILPALVKVLDFGLSRSESIELTDGTQSESGQILGNLRHMSPEILAGEKAKPASDIYAFAIMLYELATGQFPYDAAAPAEVLRAHMFDVAKSFPAEQISFPEEFESVVRKMLSKEVEARPTAADCLRTFWQISVSLQEGSRPSPK